MEKIAILLTAALLLSLFGTPFAATCSADSYSKACASCPFDGQGKMDQPCYQGFQAGGTACVASSYPLAAAKYAKGECPEIDACASELSSCKSQYSTGDDKADCNEGSTSVCFSAADQCVQKAVAKCEGVQACPAPTGLILLVLGGAFLAGYIRKE